MNALLLPRSRSWHWVAVLMVWTLALTGVGGAVVLTWSWAVVTEDDLYAAARTVSDAEHGSPGRLTPQRLMALVSEELDRDVFAHPAGATSQEQFYDVKLSGADQPTVCVEVQFSAGTDSDISSSILLVERGRCA